MLELFSEQQKSGLSIAAFQRDKSINVKHFYNRRSHYLEKTKPSAFVRVKTLIINDVKSVNVMLQYGSTKLHLSPEVSTSWLTELVKALA